MELVEMIIVYVNSRRVLYQCTLTSRLFYALSNPKLWRRPSNSGQLGIVSVNYFSALVEHVHKYSLDATPLGHHIRHLDITNPVMEDIVRLLEHTPLLERLALHSIYFCDKDLERITGLCPQLKALELSDCHLGIEQQLAPLVVKDNVLQLIKLNRCGGNLWPCLMQISTLITLVIIEKSDALQNELPRKLIDESTPWPLLRCLHVCSAEDERIRNDNDEQFDRQFYRNPLFGCSLVRFLKTHPKIGYLKLAGFRLTPTTLASVSRHLPNLVYLSLDGSLGVTSSTVRQLIKDSPRLTSLSFLHADLPRRFFPETGARPGSVERLNRKEIECIRKNPPLTIDPVDEERSDDEDWNDGFEGLAPTLEDIMAIADVLRNRGMGQVV
jgi:hypothetical protein